MHNSRSCITSVYGPVQSWRMGRSLGIDPIGATSTCSFECVYCQLGEIERKISDRQIFVPTHQILRDLQLFAPWDVDAITLSGSGEPTLALNLGAILTAVKQLTHRSVGVLTNGSLLTDATVRQELAIADWVAVKVDAVSPHQFQRVNHPLQTIHLIDQWVGLRQFRQDYAGHLAIQTMMLTHWNEDEQSDYITLMREIFPHEIHLNVPSRPKPLVHQIEARGNNTIPHLIYPWRQLKPVNQSVLEEFGDRIQQATGILVRCCPVV